MAVVAPFERSAEIYDIIHAGKKYDDEARTVLQYLEPAKLLTPYQPRLIDLGCGTGEFTKRFAQHGWQAIGVDISEPMVQRAVAKGVKAAVGRIEDLPFRDKVEAVTCLYGAFCYITAARNQESMLQRTLQAVHGTLRQRGLFVFDVIHAASAASHCFRERSVAKFGDVERAMAKRFDAERSVVYHEITYTRHDESWVENHAMRAFSVPEIKYALKHCGFVLKSAYKTEPHDSTPHDFGTSHIDKSDYYFTIVAEVR